MHIETQTKSHLRRHYPGKFFLFSLIASLSACSYVELQPGAQNIIFAKPGEDCVRIQTFAAEVKTTTLFMDRDPKVIADELQTMAQNQAYRLYGNAIWPSSEIDDGKQSFEILNCQPNAK